jgi:hypothetical protein
MKKAAACTLWYRKGAWPSPGLFSSAAQPARRKSDPNPSSKKFLLLFSKRSL